MPSRPFVRRRLQSASRLTSLAPSCVALAVLLAACSSTPTSTATPPAAPRGEPTRQAAHDLSFTSRWEIRFEDAMVGYLLEVEAVPEGIVDSRPFEPGTALIEDKDFQLIGFISPRGTTYRFNEDGVAKPVGFGSRDGGISMFFKRNGKPQLVKPGFGS